MGLFSQDCNACDESIKSPYDLPEGIAWQNEAVVFLPNGSMVIGKYDGYGRITVDDGVVVEDAIGFDSKATVYHRRCWDAHGRPVGYQGPSRDSADQGFFYDHEPLDFDDDEEYVA